MNLVPAGSEMIGTLAEIYGPVFGSTGRVILLIGAFAVLFSTFFVSNATKARLMTDALHVFRFRPLQSEDQRPGRVRFFSILFPILCFVIYAIFPKPVLLILVSGLMQAVLLPMLGIAAVYFRYRTSDPALRPSRWGDVFLLLSVLAFLVVGCTIAWNKGGDLWAALQGWF